MRTGLILGIAILVVVPSRPGAREKEARIDVKHPYQEPALVPLGEEPKV